MSLRPMPKFKVDKYVRFNSHVRTGLMSHRMFTRACDTVDNELKFMALQNMFGKRVKR